MVETAENVNRFCPVPQWNRIWKTVNMIVQIYEIQTPEDARRMIDAGVDHIGSVLLSQDHIHDDQLKQTVKLVQAAGRKSSLIPLFRQPESIIEAIEFYQPDIIHFCENLSFDGHNDQNTRDALERQKVIRNTFTDIEIMRSIPIPVSGYKDKVAALELAALFEPFSDLFLTDTLLIDPNAPPSETEQPVNGFVGITGRTCDWEIARKLVRKSQIPVILAGGLGPENTYDGILKVRPAGVDSCTQTNAVDGNGHPVRFKKDPEKVRAMVQAARKAAETAATTEPPIED